MPYPFEDPGCPHHEAALQHHVCVDNRRCIAGNEYEKIRSPAETVVSNGDPAHRVVGDVIEKDKPVRKPKEQIEPDIACVGCENSFDAHGGGSYGRF